MEAVARFIDRLNEGIGRAIAWLTLGMVLVTFIVVVLRYLFAWGSIALQESITYMHATVFMLGAAYTFMHDGHVRVDIFYRRFSPRLQAWVDLWGILLLLLPSAAFILYASFDYVTASWQLLEGSPEAGGLPGVFLLKTLIPVMALLLILAGIARGLRCLLAIFGKEEEGPEHAVREPEI